MTQGANIQTAFIAGELAPAIWGRVDNDKYKVGASTMRNGFANYQGGYASRAGSAYIGMCKQAAPNPGGATLNNVSGGTVVNTGPPRPIPFQFSVTQAYDLEFGDYYMRVIFRGAYVTETAVNISGITKANPAVFTATAHGYSNGDWVFAAGIGGMTALNGLTYVVQNETTNTFTLTDLFGNAINTFPLPAYTSGGTFSRIYTVTTPYAAADLSYLKYAQSADQMSLTCWNQITLTEYPPYDLTRAGNTDWTFVETTFEESIAPPNNVAATAQSSTTVDTWYAYVVTAVDAVTNSESIASTAAYIQNNDISVNAGSNTITWSPVTGASSYNVYQAIPYFSLSATVPLQIGVPFGYLGTALGTSFVDSNITSDFTKTPPLHSDPFAVGAVADVTPLMGGSNYTQATIGYSLTTLTGSGFIGTPIVLNGAFNGFYIQETGKDFALGDTIAITDSGSGTGATASLVIGPQTGTWPGTVAYFQERRAYAGTENNPDTYYMSQPGNYTNMDASIPSVDTDAIIGTPWAQQVNGVQFLTPMPGGLIIFTGSGIWQLSGGNSSAITPADQDAQPQSRYGCSSTIAPIPINIHILYVRENNGLVYDLLFNFFYNIYMGTDLTIYSSHLFEGYTVVNWAYAEKPYKLVWAVRSDGALLSLTYVAEQQEQGWARHDTNGFYINICSIEEPPVDAVYVIVQRFINGNWVYYHERFDNRIWTNVEDCFCVDAGLSYPMMFPNATLTASGLVGTVTFTASSGVFTIGMVGDVIRMGNGNATITSYTSSTVVVGTINIPITAVVPNDPNNTPIPAISGAWSISTPTTVVTGLNHLEGLTVTGLADGGLIEPVTVQNNQITLQQPASQITVGLPFTAQLQTLYLETPSQAGTMQTKRKNIPSVGIRVHNSRGVFVGKNQVDASTQPGNVNQVWTDLVEIKETNSTVPMGQPIPLQTKDYFVNIGPEWNEKSQVAFQASPALPLNLDAVVSYIDYGDSPG